MKLRRHNVMRMSGQNSDTIARSAVPNANGLIIRSRQLCTRIKPITGEGPGTTYYPRHLMVELNRADIVQMAMEGEHASPTLRTNVWQLLRRKKCLSRKGLTPDFDLVIVTASREQRPRRMECYASHRTCRLMSRSTAPRPLDEPSCSSNRSTRVPIW